jgi:anti-sigma B factor antagonist
MAGTNPVSPARPVVVTFPHEIDMANADELGELLISALVVGPGTVVADMSATTFCDTSGLRILVKAHKQAVSANAEFRVVVSSIAVLRAMAYTALDTVLRIYPSVEHALALEPRVEP